jgi:hypothetical protein
MRKISPPPGFDLRTVQPVTGPYTDPYSESDTELYFENSQKRIALERRSRERKV